ncbi:AraC family transcriptional regulator [Mycolicibacterium sp. 050158]|uniref:AraC family transcriptional regulator n=1 Tax=Mycolicibacterium sp. 050158 TaxID=3090602 RepID=UPI00299DECFB|nr:AraC family transcriptional regulator N-terminal domain-containing protein [Mycolicibacterium sp. 050158]MDX1890262.1 AraC family transcriptional regulator N-terminal domain-containing protein [Mycolicibacterium sp. 050158]
MGVTTGDLIAEMAAHATREGANVGLWPGLTIYRYSAPTKPQWEEIQSLSLGIIAQGRKAVTAEGKRYVYDQLNYLVLNSRLHFQAQVLEASPDLPFLSFVLQIEPALVREISAEMLERRAASSVDRAAPDASEDAGIVSALDEELASSVLRFIRSLAASTDRRVLTPLYLREMVYRVLQREQFARMLRIAAQQTASNPVAAALTYAAAHLSDPLTVSILAEQVNLSPSAFSRAFRDVTGQSPYQFVKAMRLDRARELLIEGRLSVDDLSRAVGYTSSSHFIKTFRHRFGTTPRDYADGHSLSRELTAARLGE